jgi:DNA-binding NtrC family response regulator
MQAKQSSSAARTEHYANEVVGHRFENIALVLNVLIVDDDQPVRKMCAEIAESMGCEVVEAGSVQAAQEILRFQKIDLLLVDLRLSGDGLEFLEQTKKMYPETAVVVATAFGTVSPAVKAMRIGAGNYLTKPFAVKDLRAVLEMAGQRVRYREQSRRLRERLRPNEGLEDLGRQSSEMEKMYRILSKVAFSTHPVLIFGESGTGKEVVARAIHKNGPNAERPFAVVDCASMGWTALEGELFGHVKGALAGANRNRGGALMSAEGGTLYLKEIGDLPLELQAQLLRALQRKAARPVGGEERAPVSVRVLASTSRDLTRMVEQGRFRKDLYFRLNVVNLRIPPLRERREDIRALALRFLEKEERETGVARQFSDDAMKAVLDYDWPGNLRELETVIERACALSSGPMLHTWDLPTQLQDFRMQQTVQLQMSGRFGNNDQHEKIVSIAEMEKLAILGTIRQLNGDKLMAAKLLGIGKTTLYRKLKEYGISEKLN